MRDQALPRFPNEQMPTRRGQPQTNQPQTNQPQPAGTAAQP
jgi:hypothetical protein